MKWQFAVTCTIHQTEIHALLDSWVTISPSVKMLGPQKIAGPHIFVKTKHAIDDQSSVSFSCKSVFRCVMTNCCFMGDVKPVCLKFYCFYATL
jgi:hypothetical protein